MKKIIVTGHNGYLGTLLVKLLIEKGYEVIGIDTNYYNEDCNLYPYKNNIREIQKDIRRISEEDLKDGYALCHLAALSNDPVGELDPDLTYEINYRASVRLAKLAKKMSLKKFIYSSSCSLYGIAGEEALTEEAEFNPITAYAKSKVLCEKDILPLNDKDFCVTILRNSTAYGISPKLRLDLVVNNLIGWALTTGQIKILSDGTPWRPLVHAEDIARAFIAVIEAQEDVVNGEAFNVGKNSENYQIKDIAAMIKEILPDCKIDITGEYGSDSRSYKVNFDKIEEILPHFKPQWNLKKGIEQIIEYYKKYNMSSDKFNERFFVRLKQINYLIKNKLIDSNLYWL